MNIKDLYNDNDLIKFCWTGNAGWLFCFTNHFVAIDIDLMSKRLWNFPIDISELAENLDFILITHSHDDHFNKQTVKYFVDKGHCTFVLPLSCLAKAKEMDIDESRIIWSKPKVKLNLASWLKVEPTHAFHGHIKHSIYRNANFEDCGYIITLENKRLYHPGDSVLLQEHLNITDIDVLFVSPTEHNTHIEGSISLIDSIKPTKIIAQHFGTYPVTKDNSFWTTGHQEDLKLALSSKQQSMYFIAEPYTIYEINSEV